MNHISKGTDGILRDGTETAVEIGSEKVLDLSKERVYAITKAPPANTPKIFWNAVHNRARRTLEKTNPEFEAVFDCPSAETAVSKILGSKLPEESEAEAIGRFIEYLRSTFSRIRKPANPSIWKDLQAHPDFSAATISHLRESVPKFFQNRNNRSMYEDIEFGLFLLGIRQDFDIVEDIRDDGVRGISKLFAEYHSEIVKGLSSMREPVKDGKEPTEKIRDFERSVERFEMLCEIVNKVAALHSINTLDHHQALTLIMVIATQVEVIGGELENANYDQFTRNKLKFIEGKILGNYSHLNQIEGRTAGEIFRKLASVVSHIEEGYRMQMESGFGGIPERRPFAQIVRQGNLTLAHLEAAKLAEALEPGNERSKEIRREWQSSLFDLYAASVGTQRQFSNSEEVLADFNSQADANEFAIETICHIVEHGNVSTKTLAKTVTRLITEKPYSNAFHEEFKIRLFSSALERFRSGARDDHSLIIAYWIREYAKNNEHKTWLVTSFSQLYLSLATYLVEAGSEAAKRDAMECYLWATRIADKNWQSKFEKEEGGFLKAIGGIEEFDRFKKIRLLEREADIHRHFLELIAQAIDGESKESVLRHVCEAVENLFFGICSAEIFSEKDWKDVETDDSRNVIRRGYHVSIIRSGEKQLVLQYPGNLESVFQRIFDQHKEFIRTNVRNILAIINRNHEITEANLYLANAYAELDRRTKTDEVTSLPNLRQYEEDLPTFEKAEKVRSMLFRIENLSEINWAYSISVGNEFIRSISSNILATIGSRNFDWKAYRMGPKEFLFVEAAKDDRNRGEEDFELLVQELQSSAMAHTFNLDDLMPENGENEARLHAQIAISYSSDTKTEVYQKLHIAIQDAKGGPKIVRYDGERHSEDRLKRNLAGNSLVTEAIMEDRIVPYYQAIVDIRTGEVRKYECLARLRTREGEILPPIAFIEHAKYAGVLPMITRTMFDKACRDLANTDAHFSINVSWQDLADPSLMTDLEDMMTKYGIAPERVTIEILEEALLANHSEFVRKIARLKELGCKIALDDFGSEGSNFSRFEEAWWPDIIKIDGSFIRNVETDPSKRRIARAIARAAEELWCEIVAEFVGTEGARRIVAEMGVRYGQGYLFHQPQAFDAKNGLPTKFETVPLGEGVRRKAIQTLDGGEDA